MLEQAHTIKLQIIISAIILHPQFEPPRMNQVTGVLTVGRLVTVHVHVTML